MGKYGIGARVRDRDGDLAEVIGKPEKGMRDIRFLGGKNDGLTYWALKSELEAVEAGWQVQAGTITGVAGSEINFGDAVMRMVSEPEFKVGQRVVCVDNDGAPNDYTIGQVYSVASIDGGGDEEALVNCVGIDAGMFAYRFTPFTLEAGSFYRTRDGQKVGPMERTSGLTEWPWENPDNGDSYRDDGTYDVDVGCARDVDIVAEWVESAAKPWQTIVVEDATDVVWVPAVGDRIRWLGKFDATMLTPGDVYEIKRLEDGWVGITDNDQTTGAHSWDVAGLIENFELVDTPQPKFKVGDRVGDHSPSGEATIYIVNGDRFQVKWDGEDDVGDYWWTLDRWEYHTAASDLSVGTKVILTAPAEVRMVHGDRASLLMPSGGAFTLPIASLQLAA